MKAATFRGRLQGGRRRRRKVELRDKGQKSLGESTDCDLFARNEQDNIKWGAVSWTIQKAKCTQKVFFFSFKSTILLQFISNATIYSTPKMVISIINTESQFLKLIFFKLQVLNTLCVGFSFFLFFFFLKVGVLNFSPWNWLQQKSYPLNPQKAKAVHIVFLEYFLPVF